MPLGSVTTRAIAREIARRRAHGKAALVAGVSLGLMSFTATSCNQLNKADNDVLQGEVELVGDSCATSDSIGDVRIQSGEMVDSTECQPIMNKEPAEKL